MGKGGFGESPLVDHAEVVNPGGFELLVVPNKPDVPNEGKDVEENPDEQADISVTSQSFAPES